MSGSVLVAIAVLFTTSCMVRIVPAFISLQINPHAQRYLERLLPTAVFINFAVYILHSEMVREPIAGLVSMVLVGVLAFSNRLGLIGTASLGTMLYFVLIPIFGPEP